MAKIMIPVRAPSHSAVLRWFEDETFYSLCCRQHNFMSHLKSSSTMDWLFGPDHSAITHDFPCNLESLNSEAQAVWGDSGSIIGERTILPFFFPFQSEQLVTAAIQTMKNGQIGSMKYRLGLLAGRFGAEHPLKACTACMAADQSAHGTAYWHLSHQYPGVVLCPVHGLMLGESTVNRQWTGSFQWILPSEASLSTVATPVPSATTKNILHQFGTGVLDLATCGIYRHFSPGIVRSVYKEALVQLGLAGSERDKAAISFAEFSSELQPYPPLTSLPTTARSASGFIDQLTRSPRGHCHPLKHLALIIWLFGRLTPFIEAYDRLSQLPLKKSQRKCDSSARSDEPLVSGNSVKLVRRKPKKLKPLIQTQILERLQIGDSKESICCQFGLSICTVNRLLRSEPALAKSRAKKLKEALLIQHRTNWLSAVDFQPGASAKRIRSVIPNIYAWLYRNDRDWLLEHTRNLPSGRVGNYSDIDWDERDRKLAALISDTMNRINITLGKSKPDKIEIFSQVHSLSRSLENRSHYFNTRKLLLGIK